jgi:hypothetical protein
MARFIGKSVGLLLGFCLVDGGAPLGTARAADNAAAIKDLREFLFDPIARRDFAKGKGDATQANNFLEAFPAWAQAELLEIVLMIASESGVDSSKHVTAYQRAGVQGAKSSFSPAVRSRTDAFINKLMKDPSFNNPQNLKKMNSLLPSLKSNGT